MNTKHNTIEAALEEALANDGVIYLYALPGDEYQILNPWSDSYYINATGAQLIWSDESEEIGRRAALSDPAARAALALDIVMNCGLYARANEALANDGE